MSFAVFIRPFRKALRTTVSFRTLLLVFLAGTLIGLLEYGHQSATRIEIVSLDDLYHYTKWFEQPNTSIAETLSIAIRIHCVLLWNESITEKLVKISEIWAKRCNSFSWYDSGNAMPYWWEAFRSTFKQYWTKADWFVFVEPSTYFVPENIRLFLLPFYRSKDEPVAFGSETQDGLLPFIILSIESLRWIVSSESTSFCDEERGKLLNQECLSDVGIRVIETRDQFGRHRILPYPPEQFMNRDVQAEQFQLAKRMLHPISGGPMCCSSSAFALMNVNQRMLKSVHYFVSIVHSTAMEPDYRQMDLRQKLQEALEKAKEGLPPTIIWQ